MLQLENVSLAVGGDLLVSGINWRIHPGQRVGLIGRNGSGKTTLLRAIAGDIPIDGGRVTLRADAVLGYLPQQAVSGSSAPLWEEVQRGMTRLQALEAALKRAEAEVLEGGGPDMEKAVERHDRAVEAFRIAGGYAKEERIGAVLHGLGFQKEDWRKPCTAFSGGWQMRIALARLLLSEPNLLLLDEPTNHLDLYARSWLSGFLERYPHTVVIVSHDRYLLDRAVTVIAEIANNRISTFTGNFSAWVKERSLRREQQQVSFERQQEEIARLERFVERFKATATKSSQAQSRQKVLDKMERVEAPEAEEIPRLRIPQPEGGILEPLAIRGATFGWPDRPPLFKNLDFTLERGRRVAILGPNGVGKSTLLKALSGAMPLQAGRRLTGKGVRVGVFTQDLAQDLPADRSPVEYVGEMAPAATVERVRAALGALGLKGEMALRRIGSLSGGEKARVALACFVVRTHEVLLLDEPTNHLDAVTVEVLVEALKLYEGALLMVSHDRYLVEKVATHVVHVRAPEPGQVGGRLELREGVTAEDFEPVGPGSRGDTRGDSTDWDARKKEQRERDRARKRIEAIGKEIERAEAEIGTIDEQLGTPGKGHTEIAQLAMKRKRVEQKIEGLFAEWAGLEG